MVTNKNSSLKYFILIVIIPIISIISIAIFAYSYIQDEATVLKKELLGLEKSNQIQEIIFDIQRLQGLTNIVIKDEKCQVDIKYTTTSIKTKLLQLQNDIRKIEDTDIQRDIESFVKSVQKYIKEEVYCTTNPSALIQKSILKVEQIAYKTRLGLNSEFKSYLLMNTIVFILPKLLEYNGQARGIISSITKDVTMEQKYTILTQISKIEDRLFRLKSNIEYLKNECESYDVIDKLYKDVFYSHKMLITFVKENVLQHSKTLYSSNDIFKQNSKNMQLLMALYQTNSDELKHTLVESIDIKYMILYFIIFTSLFSLFFILVINYIFHIKNKEFIHKVELLSITDSMTKLNNRREFDITFVKQQAIQKRLQKNLVFIMMDIDHFKQYNDKYGHQAGDNALIEVATSLKNNLNRANDMAFRLGGEEFGALCSDMNEEEALRFADKIREDIKNLKIEHKGNSACEFVTISLGVMIIRPDNRATMSDIYNKVDTALYEAKERGRDCVKLYCSNSVNEA